MVEVDLLQEGPSEGCETKQVRHQHDGGERHSEAQGPRAVGQQQRQEETRTGRCDAQQCEHPQRDGDGGLDVATPSQPLEAGGEPEGRQVPAQDVRRHAQDVEAEQVDTAGEQTLEGSQPAGGPVEQQTRPRRRRRRQ